MSPIIPRLIWITVLICPWVTGDTCGHRVPKIRDSLPQKIRYLDQLVDELAKGRVMEKIL